MNYSGMPLGAMDDNSGAPEEMRCKRSDGKQWRCNALSMPDKTVCEKHYIQAKKRAANSAMRANLKKTKRKYPDMDDVHSEDRHDDEPEMSRPLSPTSGSGGSAGSLKKYKEKTDKGHASHSTDTTFMRGSSLHGSICSNGERDHSGRSPGSSAEAEGLTCHQCLRNDRAKVVWCLTCNRRGYCRTCISRRYADISIEDIQRVCPACRTICSCKACLHGDNLVKIRVQEIPVMEKLRYFHRLLAFTLPIVKQIYIEQLSEIAIESRAHGIKADIPRANIHADEQMCCDFCRIPIYDYHRHCTTCLYDLCLTCCRDLRRASMVTIKAEFIENTRVEKGKHFATIPIKSDSSAATIDNDLLFENSIDFSSLHPKWEAYKDGSIPCPPEEVGGCGSSKLALRRIFKINWVSKLVRSAEEMVNGCKVADWKLTDGCNCCIHNTSSLLNGSSGLSLQPGCDGGDINLLYCPFSDDLKSEGLDHFSKHWLNGEPVIVKHAFEPSLASNWDPISIWRGVQETMEEQIKEDNITVKAVDCLDQSEIDIQLDQFIKGYAEGCAREDGRPQILKLKEWPLPNVFEEFILCHRPEVLSNLPLLEFIHSKWGIINLAAKLPHGTMQSEVGPQLYIAYGTRKELDKGDSVLNLQINMSDLVYLLMHTPEVNTQNRQPFKDSERKESLGIKRSTQSLGLARGLTLNFKDESLQDQGRHEKKRELKSVQGDKNYIGSPGRTFDGAVWDVFCRQDVSKLKDYLRAHEEELSSSSTSPFSSIVHPVYDQVFFLNKDHKQKLKEEYGVEPWTFVQHVGTAVFIPAGCPFQVRNLQSSVQLGLQYLLPESLHESILLAQEIRCLPNDHHAKLKMIEVGKISLYAASWAISEIQKIVLDPKHSLEIKFEDQSLTSMVSQHLVKISKRKLVSCS